MVGTQPNVDWVGRSGDGLNGSFRCASGLRELSPCTRSWQQELPRAEGRAGLPFFPAVQDLGWS